MQNKFFKGFCDGIPIGLGYLSVSIGVGIVAVERGLGVISALLISMTNLTSAGEVAGISVIAAGGTLIEMALIQLVINLRYSLMGISLSQKLDNSFTTCHRLVISSFITDEIFAAASSQKVLNVKYMYGIAIVPYIGWSLGTFIGAAAGAVLPASVNAALGMAIYGMFIAIVVPAMKNDKGAFCVVVIASVVSCFIYFFIPVISYGFAVILSSVLASLAVSAIKMFGRGAAV